MRINITISIITLFFLSCGSPENGKRIAQEKNEKELSIEEIRLDSIKKQEELIVFGSIRFGMNKDEFEKSKDEFIEKCIDKKIGDYKFRDITGEFYNEKLNSVTIIGNPESYGENHEKYFDNNIGFYYNALKSILKQKYGNPVRVIEFYSLSINDAQSVYDGYPYKMEHWVLGDKRMQIIIAQYNGKRFSLNLHVYQQCMVKLVEEENKRKEKILKEENEVKKQNIIKKGVDVL